MKQAFLLTATLLLTACNREEQPQAPTPAEAERLNEAEEMLNELANEDGATPEPVEDRP
jgi:uncharacterized lipoprotein YajG